MYLRDLFEAAETKIWPHGRPAEMAKRIMKQHARFFMARPSQARLDFERRATAFVTERQDEIQNNIESLRNQIHFTKQREQEAAAKSAPMSMNNAAMSASDRQMWSVLMKGCDFKESIVQRLRCDSLRTPPPFTS